jgi:hypothetical protein
MSIKRGGCEMGNPALEIEWNSSFVKYSIHWPGEKEKKFSHVSRPQ